MNDLTSPAALRRLAELAVSALLAREPVVVVHPSGWARPRGWPIPIKRMPDGEPQTYRSLAILEYVNSALNVLRVASTPGEGEEITSPNDWSDLI